MQIVSPRPASLPSRSLVCLLSLRPFVLVSVLSCRESAVIKFDARSGGMRPGWAGVTHCDAMTYASCRLKGYCRSFLRCACIDANLVSRPWTKIIARSSASMAGRSGSLASVMAFPARRTLAANCAAVSECSCRALRTFVISSCLTCAAIPGTPAISDACVADMMLHSKLGFAVCVASAQLAWAVTTTFDSSDRVVIIHPKSAGHCAAIALCLLA